MSTVGIFPCAEYDPIKVKETLEAGLEHFGGIEAFIRKQDKVLLKPNLLTAARPEEVVCTHPAVLEGVILLLKGLCAEIWVGDSPGIESTERVARVAGLTEVCERTGAKLVSFSEPVQVPCPGGRTAREFSVSNWVVQADKIINLPKLKLHNLMTFTGAVKNMLGCICGTGKGKMHFKHPGKIPFAQMLVDVYSCTKPALSIMDAIVGMEGEGPRNGRPKKVGCLLVSPDGVALDAVACKIIGLEPMSVPAIRLGNIRQAGEGKMKNIRIVGAPLPSARVNDFDLGHGGMFGPILRLGSRFGGGKKRFPEINPEKCTSCAVCVGACPCQMIEIKEGRASIDYSGCIGCLCCQELCPGMAIKLKR